MIKKLSLSQVAMSVKDFFGENAVTIKARKTKFVQRLSSLDGRRFLQTMVFGFIEDPDASLNDLSQVCLDLGVDITPQGLDQRINDKAVVFLKEMFAKAMDKFKNKIPLPLPILQQFSAIYLTDSTMQSLPVNMADEFTGSGGDASEASLKVQLVFDFLLGNLAQVAFRPGREPDQKYRDYVDLLPAGSLSITDLGYFCLDAFKAIMLERKAYFLSRLLTKTGLLTPAGERINLYEMLWSRPRQAFEINVLMGTRPQHQLPCRLICIPAPQEVADQRRRKAKEKARRRGRTPSKEYLALLGWTILVTSVPTHMLSIQQVALLYGVRWQVELVFKLWKSYCGLKRVAGLRRERVLVELYAKMIGIVLTHFLIAPLRMPQGSQANREISPMKVRKTFRRFARDLNRSLSRLTDFQNVLSEMLTHIRRFGFKDKRKKEPNVCHALALASAMCGLEVSLENYPFTIILT
ncbi:MAG: IS4 family transposase [Chloroflexi bacterium]|nr:IS4 family transposase [Chloroflexota bacterium]